MLTVRDSPTGRPTTIPRSDWQFARLDDGKVVADPRWVYMPKGFTPGKIYEMVYRANDPVVVGTGLAAVRDMMSYLKYDSSAVAHVRYGIGYGVSQTGRFIRHFLYQNFNADENGRPTFDGFFVHTAGAGRPRSDAGCTTVASRCSEYRCHRHLHRLRRAPAGS